MKFKWISLLFLFFAANIWGVKMLDANSSLYSQCADAWIEAVRISETYPQDRALLLNQLRSEEPSKLGGLTCPPLLKHHQEIVEKALTK
jgi:hypothetical protein